MITKDIRPKASLGILPLGTANDFAKGAGINAKNLVNALELACTGSSTKIDVGWMNDRYFINVASAGFGAEVTAATPQDINKLLGGMAYSIVGFIKAFQLEPYEGRLILPDGVVKEGSMLIMAVGTAALPEEDMKLRPRPIYLMDCWPSPS